MPSKKTFLLKKLARGKENRLNFFKKRRKRKTMRLTGVKSEWDTYFFEIQQENFTGSEYKGIQRNKQKKRSHTHTHKHIMVSILPATETPHAQNFWGGRVKFIYFYTILDPTISAPYSSSSSSILFAIPGIAPSNENRRPAPPPALPFSPADCAREPPPPKESAVFGLGEPFFEVPEFEPDFSELSDWSLLRKRKSIFTMSSKQDLKCSRKENSQKE